VLTTVGGRGNTMGQLDGTPTGANRAFDQRSDGTYQSLSAS